MLIAIAIAEKILEFPRIAKNWCKAKFFTHCIQKGPCFWDWVPPYRNLNDFLSPWWIPLDISGFLSVHCRSLIVLAAEMGTKWWPEKRTFENGLKRANSVKKRMRMKIFSLAALCTLSKKTIKSKTHVSIWVFEYFKSKTHWQRIHKS